MFPNFLRTCPSLITFATGIVKLMQLFNWKHLAVITQEEDLFTLVNCIKLICMIQCPTGHISNEVRATLSQLIYHCSYTPHIILYHYHIE